MYGVLHAENAGLALCVNYWHCFTPYSVSWSLEVAPWQTGQTNVRCRVHGASDQNQRAGGFKTRLEPLKKNNHEHYSYFPDYYCTAPIRFASFSTYGLLSSAPGLLRLTPQNQKGGHSTVSTVCHCGWADQWAYGDKEPAAGARIGPDHLHLRIRFPVSSTLWVFFIF